MGLKTFTEFFSERTVKKLTPKMVRDYERRAESERRAGGSIEIDTKLPSVAITMSNGDDYFFQEHEASELLDDMPDNIAPEDFILAIAQGW